MSDDHDEGIAREWYDRKSAMMASILGEEHDTVMHEPIPYAIGGGLDLYYFPNGITGTAIAAKQLCELPGDGSSNDLFNTYELVIFTRYPMSPDDAKDTRHSELHRSAPAGRL